MGRGPSILTPPPWPELEGTAAPGQPTWRLCNLSRAGATLEIFAL